MRFALLGVDSQSLELARWIAAQPDEHWIELIYDPGLADGVLRGLAPQAEFLTHWEGLLASARIDAVIVAAAADDEEPRIDQLRKLIQERVPLLVSHPVCRSMLACHELDMIRHDTRAVIVPYAPAALHPALDLLADWLRGSDAMQFASSQRDLAQIGDVEQLFFERVATDRSRQAVLTAFARDVLLIQRLLGEIQRITALGAAADAEASYANLALQLASEDDRPVRWTIGAAESTPGARLTLQTAHDKAVLWMPDTGDWELTLPGHDAESVADQWQPPCAAIDALQQAMAGVEPDVDWSAAARAVEVAEAVPRSLARGRTIELHREAFSESGTFKGMMTSLGCGLLLAAMVTLFVGALIQTILAKAGQPEAASIVGYCWIFGLAGLLLTFLALQFLLPLAQTAEAREAAESEPSIADGTPNSGRQRGT